MNTWEYLTKIAQKKKKNNALYAAGAGAAAGGAALGAGYGADVLGNKAKSRFLKKRKDIKKVYKRQYGSLKRGFDRDVARMANSGEYTEKGLLNRTAERLVGHKESVKRWGGEYSKQLNRNKSAINRAEHLENVGKWVKKLSGPKKALLGLGIGGAVAGGTYFYNRNKRKNHG